jgi:hypothetical protein
MQPAPEIPHRFAVDTHHTTTRKQDLLDFENGMPSTAGIPPIETHPGRKNRA